MINWKAHKLTFCVLAQSRLTPCDPLGCSPPGSSVYWVFQASVPEWYRVGCHFLLQGIFPIQGLNMNLL